MPYIGTVSLVGAGPGDPKLLTIAGAEALRKADIVVYDRLAHPSLLKLAPADSEKIYVGKQADRHAKTQDEINKILVDAAQAGHQVVRLKGGDPFVFGRGGEEAEVLAEHGIPFRIIPGITSAIAAPAYAGIPVTHRDLASSFAVITGHERADYRESGTREPGDAEQRRDWSRIAFAADTLVFLMGVESIAEITGKLIEHGARPADTSRAIRWATWAGQQETLTGNLAGIAVRCQAARLQSARGDRSRRCRRPARSTALVGQSTALSGKRIVVTRRAGAGIIAGGYPAERGRGADRVPSDPDRIPAGLLRGARQRGPKVGSVQLADIHIGQWCRALHGPPVPPGIRYAPAGRIVRSARSAPAPPIRRRKRGIAADYVPTVYTGAEAAKQFPGSPKGLRILVPRALEAGEDLPGLLADAGADVDIVPAYQTLIDGSGAGKVAERIKTGTVDIVTFTSSSTVKNFVTALGPIPSAHDRGRYRMHRPDDCGHCPRALPARAGHPGRRIHHHAGLVEADA